MAEVCEHFEGRLADSYSAALTMDVGTLEQSRGALEAARHRLRTGAIQRR
jgi:hypothetical protein